MSTPLQPDKDSPVPDYYADVPDITTASLEEATAPTEAPIDVQALYEQSRESVLSRFPSLNPTHLANKYPSHFPSSSSTPTSFYDHRPSPSAPSSYNDDTTYTYGSGSGGGAYHHYVANARDDDSTSNDEGFSLGTIAVISLVGICGFTLLIGGCYALFKYSQKNSKNTSASVPPPPNNNNNNNTAAAAAAAAPTTTTTLQVCNNVPTATVPPQPGTSSAADTSIVHGPPTVVVVDSDREQEGRKAEKDTSAVNEHGGGNEQNQQHGNDLKEKVEYHV